MKNKFFKCIMSLALVAVMAVSTMAVSAFSASAATVSQYSDLDLEGSVYPWGDVEDIPVMGAIVQKG